MPDLIQHLTYAKVYLDDILVPTMGNLIDKCLRGAGLNIIVKKSIFATNII